MMAASMQDFTGAAPVTLPKHTVRAPADAGRSTSTNTTVDRRVSLG